MTISEMKLVKRELGFTNQMIAEASGIPLGTVQKIFSGETKAPRRKTLLALERALSNAMLLDPPAQYNTAEQRTFYTIDDYYALPDEERKELIDGTFYDMAAPTWIHQTIVAELHLLFRECTDKHNMPCTVQLSPCDVRLNKDDYTMVQPDLFVVCHPLDLGPRAIRYEGAPDLVVEIQSRSSRFRDESLKLFKYGEAGVREYWIVDPKNKKVTVWRFEADDADPETYSFTDTIPIGISGGSCSIDFGRVLKAVGPYLEKYAPDY